MIHEEIVNLNRLIMNKEIESVTKKSQQRKAEDQIASMVYPSKHLNKNYANPS